MPRDWIYRRGESQFGPFEGSELKQLAVNGTLMPTDLVSRTGLGKWVPAAKVGGLFGASAAPSEKPRRQASAAQALPSRETASNRTLPSLSDGSSARHTLPAAGNHKLKYSVPRVAFLTVGIIAVYAGLQYFAVPVKSSPDAETWKDFVDATFFEHHLRSLDANGPYLLNLRRTDDKIMHILAISYSELENTNLVDHPVQGVLKGKYHVFPCECSEAVLLAGDAEKYQEYEVELRFVPDRNDVGYEREVFETCTVWRMKTAMVTRTSVGGRFVDPVVEHLRIQQKDSMLDDERFLAISGLFYPWPLGGYWPQGETLARASRHVKNLRPRIERGLSGVSEWCSSWDPGTSNPEAALTEARNRVAEEIKGIGERSERLLTQLPPSRQDYRGLSDPRQRLSVIRKARDAFIQLQEEASRAIAITAIAEKYRLYDWENDLLQDLPGWEAASEAILRTVPGRELFLPEGKPTQQEIAAVRSAIVRNDFYRVYRSASYQNWPWRYPPPSPRGGQRAVGEVLPSRSTGSINQTYSARYEILSPGAVSVRYRNGLGGWDDRRFSRREDGKYSIEVVLPADETAIATASALDRDSPIAVWLYVNGRRVAVSTNNDGGGTVSCSGNLRSPEK